MSIRPQGILHKCTRCCALAVLERPFMLCYECKAVKYCSIKCQQADRQRHRMACEATVRYERSRREYNNAEPGKPRVFCLPDRLTPYELSQLLEAWVRAHTRTLMLACMHAIRLPDDYDRVYTHVLAVQVRLLWHATSRRDPARIFAVDDAFTLSVAEVARLDDAWRRDLKQLRAMQSRTEENGAGRTGLAMIDCAPLPVQWVPFWSMRPVLGCVQENWKDVLIKDVREGKTVTRLFMS